MPAFHANRFRAASALMALLASGLDAAPCTLALKDYQGYRIGQVSVSSPTGFFSMRRRTLDRIAKSLPLRAGDRFDLARLNRGSSQIAAALRDSSDTRIVRIVAAAGVVSNCDAAGRTVDVQYLVYSAAVPVAGAIGQTLAAPLVGYNQTRGGYAGIRLRAGGLDFRSAASGNGFDGTLGWKAGSWRFSASYRDLPAGGVRLVQSTLAAGLFASLRSLHYGVSLEGGSGRIAIKLLAGGNGRLGAGSWNASYGLELGGILPGRTGGFVKQVVDARYTFPFDRVPSALGAHPSLIGSPHRPVTVEARLGGGVLQSNGIVPLAERFFGGNQKQSFTENAAWEMLGQPYIRSVPENRMGGGTRFYTLNLTVSKPAYARPLLPRELGASGFAGNLNFALNTARGELADGYLSRDPALAAARQAVPPVLDVLNAVKAATGTLPVEVAPRQLRPDLGRAIRTAGSARDGGPLVEALSRTILPRVESDLANLRDSLEATGDAPAALEIEELRRRLADARQTIAANLSAAVLGAARDRAERRATRDFSEAEQALRAVLYELNVVSIAPAAIFDVARVWPSGDRVQYAAGGGIRLSLVNVNFTAGYAANPRASARQARGAVFFQLDVSDLFR